MNTATIISLAGTLITSRHGIGFYAKKLGKKQDQRMMEFRLSYWSLRHRGN